MAAWTLFSKVLGSREADDGAHDVPAPLLQEERPVERVREDAAPLVQRGPLDEIGQQNERVRERINHLSLRLDDLKSLADDFGQIVQPVHDFIIQHSQTQSRLLEAEALLSRERELSSSARAELNELHGTSTRLAGDLSASVAELRGHQERGRDLDASLTQARLRIDDQTAVVDSLEKQLDAEGERARMLADENQGLRAEIDSLEQFRSRAETDLSEAREQISIGAGENLRLQQLAENLSQRMSALKSQIHELEPQILAGRQEVSLLQTKLSTEQLARQKAEVTRDAERSAQDSEISSLTMKLEGHAAHIQTTERIVSNLREQLRDKSESLRAAERTLKETHSERSISDRRLEASQEVSARQLAQINEIQRAAAEHKDRGDMLGKALGAKEALLDSGNRKIANLTSRMEQMSARFEQERASLESANRRLIEELQSEKAERSLAQGALDIARNSRSKLLTQYTALKRQQSFVGTGRAEMIADDEPLRLEAGDNVHIFNGSDKDA